MAQYTIHLTPETALFYEAVAHQAGLQVEQVLSDSLFRFAGELAVDAIQKKEQTGTDFV